MKKYIVLSVCAAICLPVCAQPGINGAGFFENTSELSEQWIADAVGNDPWVLRVPGGAIAKFADPMSGGGWGLNYACIDTIQPKYGSPDEEDQTNALQKWHRKADQEPDYSYLDELDKLQEQYPNMSVIWVANMYIPANRALYPIQYLLSKGVNIAYIEGGNESYSQVDYDWNYYLSLTEPLVAFADSAGIPFSFTAANVGLRSSREKQEWNALLNSHLSTREALAVATEHKYIDGREIAALKTPVDQAAAIAGIAAFDFDAYFGALRLAVPNAEALIITESNAQPASLIGGTEANRVLADSLFSAGMRYNDVFCLHNGVSPDVYGIIYGEPPQKNTTYSSFANAVLAYAAGLPDEIHCDTLNTVTCDSITTIWLDTTYIVTEVANTEAICSKWYAFLFAKRCKPKQITVPVITEHEAITITCDTVTEIDCETAAQPLDADTLVFNNETEFRDFLAYHGIADYPVIAPKFDYAEQMVDVVPYKWQANNTGAQIWAPDASYYDVGIASNLAYLNEPLFAGKKYVSIRDHCHLQKMEREMRPVYCPDADLFGIIESVTHPVTGQVVVFNDIYRWSDRNGENIWNENLHLWLLWGFDKTTTFPLNSLDPESGCDMTFRDYFPGHADMTLSFKDMLLTYGHLLINNQ